MAKIQQKQKELTATINQKMASAKTPAVATAKAIPEATKKGRAVQVWLHDQDRQLIQELRIWLMGQGRKPTESQVIRAALRIAKQGPELLTAQDEVSALDGRRKAL
jgi:hypothetical protein